MSNKTLKPVVLQPGRPLYLTVKDHVREAIESGVFRPGEQMPSTKNLSEKMDVSLVTAHRALQELVNNGVLYRAQGKGTFVHDHYLEHDHAKTNWRIGVLLHHSLSLGSNRYGEILDGIRQASQNLGVELLLMRVSEDIRRECMGYLSIDCYDSESSTLASRLTRRQPMLTVGGPAAVKGGACVRVDTTDMAGRALQYLVGLGHERIGYIGGEERVASQRDRFDGAKQAATELDITLDEQNVIMGLDGEETRQRDQAALARMLTGPKHPTAILAGGFAQSLLLYSAAETAGMRIPDDLSIVGFDDPNCAGLLNPALTAVREPAAQIGQAAVSMLCENLQHPETTLASRILKADLVVRRSCAMVKK